MLSTEKSENSNKKHKYVCMHLSLNSFYYKIIGIHGKI